jgi:hypothetical protein
MNEKQINKQDEINDSIIEIENTEIVLDEKPKEDNSLIPSMNLNLSNQNNDVSQLISDETVVTVYEEILNNLRTDRIEVDEYLNNFADMVFNGGDSTTSSKEALINLIKVKSDTADKMAKIADLMTRIKLKERDTFPRYLAASQNNTINVGDGAKRALLEAINKAQKDKEDKNE